MPELAQDKVSMRRIVQQLPLQRPHVLQRFLGYSFQALIVARFAKQSTTKRRSSDAGLQA
jgi:hypothetical protein